MAQRIVVVEDDPGIGESLQRTLQGQGYEVAWVRTATEGAAAISPLTALVVLDLGLPDGDGLDLCRRLQTGVVRPQVLILTARHEEADVVLGLDAGADDYITKPFRLAELLARVRACTRRVDEERDVLTAGDLEIDVAAHEARIDGVAIELRPKEFDLLLSLARNAGRVSSRQRIFSEVWSEDWYGPTKTLDIHVWALRRKLDRGDGPSRITTVRGVGYRLEVR